MARKRLNTHSTLRFPSGYVKHVVASRRELARTLCEIEGNGWHRLAKPLGDDADAWSLLRSIQTAKQEERAARSLERYGMIDVHESDSNCVRWSILHERPIFGMEREVHEIYGHVVHNLSSGQKELITLVLMAGARRMRHEILTLNNPKLRRMVGALVRRGVLTVEKRESVWSLGLGEKYRQPAERSESK